MDICILLHAEGWLMLSRAYSAFTGSFLKQHKMLNHKILLFSSVHRSLLKLIVKNSTISL